MITIENTRADHASVEAVNIFNSAFEDWHTADTRRRRYVAEHLEWCAYWLKQSVLMQGKSIKALRKLLRDIRKVHNNFYTIREISTEGVNWWRDFPINERLKVIEAMLEAEIKRVI